MNDADKLIRKNWLRASSTYFLVFLVLVLISNAESETATEFFVRSLIGVLRLAVPITLIFYFAYRKFGTKYIGSYLFISPILNLRDLFKSPLDMFSDFDITIESPFYIFTCLIICLLLFSLPLFLYGYFWIHCKRLYNLNWEIKDRKKMNPICKEGQECITA